MTAVLLFLVKHPPTEGGFKTTHTICSSSLTHRNTDNTLLQRFPTPQQKRESILTKDNLFHLQEGLHVEAGSLQRTHGAARRVDCPRHGVLAVVHNVCLHHTLQI